MSVDDKLIRSVLVDFSVCLLMCYVDTDSLPRAYSDQAVGSIREQLDDFQVTEHLGFELTESGTHYWLFVEKTNLNTAAVQQALAQALNLKMADIGFSGLKDKRAVTRQWFSLPFAAIATEMEGVQFELEQINVLQVSRHDSKLKRGSHQSNTFEIIIRNIRGDVASVSKTLEQIKQRGVPNYFGPQRFGNRQKNLQGAHKLFASQSRPDKLAKGMFLSAARSYLFNLMLAQRVSADSWDYAREGDAMVLDGSNSFFVPNEIDDILVERIRQGDIHPSAALWGKGALASFGATAASEQHIADEISHFSNGLCAHGLKQKRRALRVIPAGLIWNWIDSETLTLKFNLPKGTFATSLLREVVKISP